jgi:hypothetical protein
MGTLFKRIVVVQVLSGGVRVDAIANSCSAITEPNVNVPDGGASLVMLGVAIGGAGLRRRKLS